MAQIDETGRVLGIILPEKTILRYLLRVLPLAMMALASSLVHGHGGYGGICGARPCGFTQPGWLPGSAAV
jgi:hypothetical protein